LEIFIFSIKKKFFFSDEQKWQKKKKKKKVRKKNFIKFFSERGPKSLALTVFLAEKTEPNYDTVYKLSISYSKNI
jgi:hypothetical protein